MKTMKFMQPTLIALAAAATMLAAPANSAANSSQSFETILMHAKRAELEAREISDLLKNKNPDLQRVGGKLDQLDKHADQLTQEIASFSGQDQLTPAQRKEFEHMKMVADIINAFVENKRSMLASSDPQKKRSILRAKADGIALRAEMVQRSALRIRS